MIDHDANFRIAGHGQYSVVFPTLFQKSFSDTDLILARTMPPALGPIRANPTTKFSPVSIGQSWGRLYVPQLRLFLLFREIR
jgi:hypothetical protein